MKIFTFGFPKIIADNESTYFSYLVGYIESIDHTCTLQVTKKIEGLNVRISPTRPIFTNPLIEGIKKFHNLYGIRVDFSKSMKTSVTINFNINF